MLVNKLSPTISKGRKYEDYIPGNTGIDANLRQLATGGY
jgi:hypothetical protein